MYQRQTSVKHTYPKENICDKQHNCYLVLTQHVLQHTCWSIILLILLLPKLPDTPSPGYRNILLQYQLDQITHVLTPLGISGLYKTQNSSGPHILYPLCSSCLDPSASLHYSLYVSTLPFSVPHNVIILHDAS